ncbi:uncharacterized protein LOC131023599 [Salvia miltiorrhiza]|uniref:uncharacterized protein LOC131023599 n=1 Tax=Salvia miltiorrhiza TaxID=226208 RepID=UPI0025AD8622|nr:uncharacterized protein LOC131023599 [Salvia miltiorrhiza]
MIGNGKNTLFWEDRWVGHKPLKFVFPRLFQLCVEKKAVISDLGRWANSEWIWDLKWRRELFDREKPMINELLSFISGLDPVASKDDGWCWRASKVGVFTTSSAYKAIKDMRKNEVGSTSFNKRSEKAWKIRAPQKAKVTVWRILRNRLPTCDNLSKRNIPLGDVEIMCNAYCQEKESADHLFLSCPKTEMIWNEIQKWTGFYTARPDSIEAHFDSFIHMGRGKKSKKLLEALWTCTTWLIWKGRNESRFENKNWQVEKLMGEIKARLWSWNKVFNLVDVEINFRSWFSYAISHYLL